MSTTLTRPGTRVLTEPLTYNPYGEHSFFADHRRAQNGDVSARARLDRHAAEMRTVAKQRRTQTAPDGVTFEQRSAFEMRAEPTGGYSSTPPLWLIDATAVQARPDRQLAALTPTFPLPSGVSSVNIPIITAGTLEQPTPAGTAVPSSLTLNDGATSSAVVEISGMLDVPLGMIEQGGPAFDQVVFADLLSAYDYDLESQLITGLGGTIPYAELVGVLNVPGAGAVTYTDASPKAIAMYPYIGQALGAVANARKRRPTALVMRFGRWEFLTTGEDNQGLPLGVPDAHQPPPRTPANMPDPVGALVGVNCYTSEAIPTNLPSTSATGNQDVIIACRPSDWLLFEGDPVMDIFTEVLSGDLMGRIVLRNYAAALLGRYGASTAVLSGTGMAVQTNE